MDDEVWRVNTRSTDWVETSELPNKPVLYIQYQGPSSGLLDRLEEFGVTDQYPTQIDVSYRFLPEHDDSDDLDILTISDSQTGEIILESPVENQFLSELVTAATRYADETGDEVQYYVELHSNEGLIWDYEKQVLLVYSSEGDLLRSQSLIPTWVEI